MSETDGSRSALNGVIGSDLRSDGVDIGRRGALLHLITVPVLWMMTSHALVTMIAVAPDTAWHAEG